MRYDFQNIVYSSKNDFGTKNIIIDYNNENRLGICNLHGVFIVAKY